ncbi:MAG: hypothetical protein RIE08_08805 [Acidimicrobiales bacterium]
MDRGAGDARDDKDLLIGDDKKEPHRFRLVMTREMGVGRKTGKKTAGFIDSVLDLITDFYGTVARNLTRWTPPAPKITRPKPIPEPDTLGGDDAPTGTRDPEDAARGHHPDPTAVPEQLLGPRVVVSEPGRDVSGWKHRLPVGVLIGVLSVPFLGAFMLPLMWGGDDVLIAVGLLGVVFIALCVGGFSMRAMKAVDRQSRSQAADRPREAANESEMTNGDE